MVLFGGWIRIREEMTIFYVKIVSKEDLTSKIQAKTFQAPVHYRIHRHQKF
jgi:histidyl-tRNA synthetase